MIPPMQDWSLQDTWPPLFTNSDLLAVWTDLCWSPGGNVGGSCLYLWSGQSTRQDKADYNILLVQTGMATHCCCIHTVSSFFHVPWFLDSRLQKLHECFFFFFPKFLQSRDCGQLVRVPITSGRVVPMSFCVSNLNSNEF